MAENISNLSLKKFPVYVDDNKNTVLHYAAAYGNLEEATKEVENKCEIDSVNFLNWTPLMMAARNGHTDVVNYLLEKRADSTKTNSFGINILILAVASGNLKVLQLILQYLLCGGVSKQSMQRLLSPISLAVLFNNVEVIQYLIEKGFCLNSPTPQTEITPFMFANVMGNQDIINLLHKKGAKSVNSVTTTTSKRLISRPPPLVLINSNPYSPQHFVQVSPYFQVQRRSSDLTSPCFTPNISPFTPGPVMHPVFYFPNQFISPVNASPIFNNYENPLNVRMMHQNPCFPLMHY